MFNSSARDEIIKSTNLSAATGEALGSSNLSTPATVDELKKIKVADLSSEVKAITTSSFNSIQSGFDDATRISCLKDALITIILHGEEKSPSSILSSDAKDASFAGTIKKILINFKNSAEDFATLAEKFEQISVAVNLLQEQLVVSQNQGFWQPCTNVSNCRKVAYFFSIIFGAFAVPVILSGSIRVAHDDESPLILSDGIMLLFMSIIALLLGCRNTANSHRGSWRKLSVFAPQNLKDEIAQKFPTLVSDPTVFMVMQEIANIQAIVLSAKQYIVAAQQILQLSQPSDGSVLLEESKDTSSTTVLAMHSSSSVSNPPLLSSHMQRIYPVPAAISTTAVTESSSANIANGSSSSVVLLSQAADSTSLMEVKRIPPCIVCYSSHRNIILAPCGHFQLCKACAEKVDKCPIFREGITKRLLVVAAMQEVGIKKIFV